MECILIHLYPIDYSNNYNNMYRLLSIKQIIRTFTLTTDEKYEVDLSLRHHIKVKRTP